MTDGDGRELIRWALAIVLAAISSCFGAIYLFQSDSPQSGEPLAVAPSQDC
jgi:hypothetical protein